MAAKRLVGCLAIELANRAGLIAQHDHPMKVLDLQCGQQHSFEGWFGSEDDFQSQLQRGLVECPLCADRAIVKMLSAPRLNFGATRPTQSSSSSRTHDARGDHGDDQGEHHSDKNALTTAASHNASDPATGRDVAHSGESGGPKRVERHVDSSMEKGGLLPSAAVNPAAQAAFLTALRRMLADTEDVGNRFANEARAMHYGDAQTRSIRGQASPQEAMALLDEGIDVLPLVLPEALKQTLQ